MLLSALLALPLLAAGCGDDGSARKNPRPPVPLNVSVQIGADGVSASPLKFGAGPITLLVSNQSDASHQLTIDGPRLRESVGPINPRDTATLKVAVQSGEYTLSTEQSALVRPARLIVGPERRSAQNTLLLP